MGNAVTFSIIIPVYNMEKYLHRCMDSILSQDYGDYEVIAIDDGATDRSAQILEEYKGKNKNVKVRHKENGGIGSAVPIGIEISENNYIVFVDGDDYVREDMLKTLSAVIQESDYPDIVQFGLLMADDTGRIIREERHGDYHLDKTDEIIKDHFQNHPTPSLACRCFKKELFEDTECPKQNVGIDEVLIVQLVTKAKSFVSIDDALYYVYLRENSVSRSIYSEQKIREYEKVYEILFSLSGENVSLSNYIKIKYMKLIIGILRESSKNSEIYKNYQKKYKDTFSTLKSSREYKSETLLFRLGSRLFYYAPDIYRALKSLDRRR